MTHTDRRSRITLGFLVGMGSLFAALAPAPAVQDAPAENSVKALGEARAKVCERMLDYYRESLKAPPAAAEPVNNSPASRYAANYEPIELWSRRLVDARLDSAASREERVALLTAEVKRIETFAVDVAVMAKDQPEWRVVSDRIEFYRLDARSRLAKEVAGR